MPKNKYERIIGFERGHDCIRFECVFKSDSCQPGAGGSHGTHGLQMRFVLKGRAGAVQFVLYTGWVPQPTNPPVGGWGAHGVLPAELGYHSPTPRYDGQSMSRKSCEFCDGRPCYYDASGLNADDAMLALVNGGEEGLWAFLEGYYEHVFGKAEYPKPAEYPMPLRKNAR